MPAYEYECESCKRTFEIQQPMTAKPLTECPECHGKIHRLISGGSGFLIRGSSGQGVASQKSACSLEQTGQTCCGRNERCGKPSCETTL